MAKTARGSYTRDSQGRVLFYRVDARYGAKLPSKARIREVIRQAQKQGATRAALVAEVGAFQGYEMHRGEKRIVRAFRKGDTPEALRGRLGGGPVFQGARGAVLNELRAASGAEQIKDLQGFQINFYYG